MKAFLCVPLLLIASCATARPATIDVVKVKPDLEPVTYASSRPIHLVVTEKIPDEFILHSIYLDNGTTFTHWRTTTAEAIADVFRPHMSNLSVVVGHSDIAAQFQLTKAEFIHEEAGYILSYRIQIYQNRQEVFRVEGRAQGGNAWLENAGTTARRALETALKNLQRDMYNRLFVSAEGKSFRAAFK